MHPFEIRPASVGDIPRLIALDHSCQSDYVWQLELRREAGQVVAGFREVRLPRSIEVKYPRNPSTLSEEWTRRDVALTALDEGNPIGYIFVKAEYASAVAWVTAGLCVVSAATAWFTVAGGQSSERAGEAAGKASAK